MSSATSFCFSAWEIMARVFFSLTERSASIFIFILLVLRLPPVCFADDIVKKFFKGRLLQQELHKHVSNTVVAPFEIDLCIT